MKNNQLQHVYRNKNNSCSCYVFKASMMQCKPDIRLTKNFNLSKIGKSWLKRKNITQSSNKGLFNSPTIVRYNKMESVSHDEQMVCNESEITNNTGIDDDLMNNNELQNINDTEIEDTSPDNDISYYAY